MAKKLLHKTLLIYLWCSIVVLLVAIPVFYFALQRIYTSEVDETLVLNAQNFKEKYLPHFEIKDIPTWNNYSQTVEIKPATNSRKSDTIFSASYWLPAENEMEPYRVFQMPITVEGKPFLYTAKISVLESRDLITSIGAVFVVLIISFVLILLIVTRLFSKRIWLPFRQSLNQLKEFNLAKEKPLTFKLSSVQEFNQLNASLKRLTDKNISIYTQQKSFIENASHELQTPLAVLKSKMDLLLQNEAITPEQSNLLSALELPLSRVIRINKNLLLLAKIENNQFSETQSIKLTDVLNETMELLSDFSSSKVLSIEKKMTKNIELSCNRLLLEMLISNLLVNAIVHNTKNGHIKIETTEERLTISNTGQSALNKEYIFQRFSVASNGARNTGLGLAIVKGVCERYGWMITYQFQNQQHCFSVSF